MLSVVFVNTENTEKIERYKHYLYHEAVALTEAVEKECRKEKVKFAAEFHIVSDAKLFYEGVFNFGSYDYQNLYHQIREKAPKLQTDKSKENDRLFLLEQNEELTPDVYKQIEEIDKTFINLEKTNISKLKKWQRILFYSAAVLGVAGSVALGFYLVTLQGQFEKALANEAEKNTLYIGLVEQYEQAIQGNKSDLIPYLEGLQVVNQLSESQTQLLIKEYLLSGQFEKAVAINDDLIFLETLILSSNLLSDEEKAEKISAFNDLYPTNEARFDLAYFEKDYALILNISNINMTVQRSEMKTYAYLKLGQIDEAKRELNNNKNQSLEEKIVRYEVLDAEIKTLESKKSLVGEEELASLQQEIDSKIKELNAL